MPRWLRAASLLFCAGCNGALISLLPEELAKSGADTTAFDGGESNEADVTNRGPSDEWKLVSTALDSVGTTDGTVLGGGTFGGDAIRGNVLLCNGTDAAVRLANITPNSFTYTAWIWSDVPSSKGSNAIDGDALIWSNVLGKDDDFALSVLDDHLSYINYNETSTGTVSITDAKWHQVAVTRQDGARVQLYVDGALDGDGNAGSGDVLADPYVFFCGVDANGGHFFHGKMADVRLYPRVLTAAQVEVVFSTGP